jgi:hypothetical protein
MKGFVLVCALTSGLSGLTYAAESAAGWYVSPLLQWWDLDAARRAAGHVAGEVGLGFAFDDSWAVEAEGAGASFASRCGCQLRLAAASIDGLRKFRGGEPVQPYLIAGVGAMHDSVARSPSSTGPTAEAGIGVLAAFEDDDAVEEAGPSVWQWRAEVKYRREFDDRTATRSSVGDLVAGVGLQYNFR